MGKELFEKRKLEFKQFVIKEKRLPKVWESKFRDKEDLRIWYDQISKISKFKSFIEEINEILTHYNVSILTDKEKEEQFLKCIEDLNRIPSKNERTFSDNDDMYTWYMKYKTQNRDFETIVHEILEEYQEIQMSTIWPDVKEEFISIIKQLKRVPEHGEVTLQNKIDARVIYDKLINHDPQFIERLLLHLQTYNKNALSIDDRITQLLDCISTLGYIPELQEARFTDKTDMFTWYMKYKEKLPHLEKEVLSRIKIEKPNKKVNIYLIPNFKKTGGKFYTICSNTGERLDLSEISSFEEALELDETIVKRGGVILKQDEEIDTITLAKGKSRK